MSLQNYRRKCILAAIIVFVCFFWTTTRVGCQDQQEEPERSLKLSTLETSLSPHFEFTLPSGNVSQKIEQQFNNLHTVFSLDFNFLDSSINADVAFLYPLGFFIPGIDFFQNVDLENLVAPQFQDGELTLLPSEKYISRLRGIGLDFVFSVSPIFLITPAFLVNDTFKGDFTEDLTIDEGIDWVAKLSFVVDSAKSQPREIPEPKHRIAFSSVFNIRFRNVLTNPVSVANSNLLQTDLYFRDQVFITESFGFNYPVYIWNREISSYYTLGGFNTIRGFPFGSIASFRYVLNRFDLNIRVLSKAQIKLKLFKRKATIHDYRILFILDGLLTQDHLSWRSAANLYGSGGGGFSFLLTGEKQQHIKVSTYLVQPFETGRLPIFYLQTSFYNFEKQL